MLRNAGGVITDDVIRSLAISQRRLGTREVMLIHHTDCGMQALTDDGFRAELQAATGLAPAFAIESFTDVDANVRQSILRVRRSPFLLHRDGRAKLYLTVIAAENARALETIASNRAGLPRYAPLGRVFSPAVRLRGWKRKSSCGPDIRVWPREQTRMSAPHNFILAQLSRRQIAPAELLADHFYAAYDGDRIIGALAVWDQSAFKQTRVVRYRGAMRLLQTLLGSNGFATGSRNAKVL